MLFVFKQKTAYEMRISDWSSDVCSSDLDRDGFVLGEGAGALLLEEYEHARRRGARIYGEFAGYGMSSDAHHITSPDRDGPRRGVVNALRNGGINPDQVGYVNAPRTSTPLGASKDTRDTHLAESRRGEGGVGGGK